MRLHICAVGRMKTAPEASLVNDYTTRVDRAGRPLSLGPVILHEVDDRKGGGMAGEAALLRRAIPDGSLVCALDERGRTMSSPDFSELLRDWRDSGRQDATFVIGGADGIDLALRDSADQLLSFGKMVWPHMLVRAMLAEQLYRAVSILSGTPYHRA